jgi:predicted RNA-binding protein with RPS1 domain
MAMEIEAKSLTAEDVVKIVEETLEKRESKARSKPVHSEPEPVTAPVIDVDALARKIGESIATALDRREAKQAEARAKAEAEKAEAEKKRKAELEKKRRWPPFA